MASFRFTDSDGTNWMVLPGLPLGFPDGGEGDSPLAGLTFRADSGEVRVLPRAAFPRRSSGEILVAPLGMRSRVREVDPVHLQELLRHAIRWPPA